MQHEFAGQNLIFIVGCQRSGTTWLQKLLTSHPKVFSGAESYLFAAFVGPSLRRWNRQLQLLRGGSATYGLPCYFTEEEFMRIFKNYMFSLLQPMTSNLKQGEFFLEKTPDNAYFIPEIVQLLPQSRFIHLVRDGRDVVASLLRSSRSWGWYWAPRTAGRAATIWVDHINAVRKASPYLASEQFIEVRYEQLLESAQDVLRKLMSWLNLECTERYLVEAIRSNTPEISRETGGTEIPLVGEAARIAGNKMLQPKGFIGRAVSGSWKTDLTLSEKIIVWRKIAKTMNEEGYPWRSPW